MSAWAQHERAVERLRASYAAIPAGAPVRLAKKTSNLFRTRAATRRAGLDVSGLDGVIEVDPEARTADVQGMCTYEDLVDATLPHGLIPLVVPQLRTITLGGAVTGLGIESTSFRNGLPHESVLEMDVFTGAGEVVTTRPGDDLFDAFPNSYGSLGYATRLQDPARAGAGPGRAAARPLRRRRPARQDRRRDRRDQDVRRRAGRRPRRGRVRAGEYYLTLARWTDETERRADQRLHRPADLLPLDPAARRPTCSPSTTTCGAGTPTGSGAPGPWAPSTRWSAGCGRGAGSARTSTTG